MLPWFHARIAKRKAKTKDPSNQYVIYVEWDRLTKPECPERGNQDQLFLPLRKGSVFSLSSVVFHYPVFRSAAAGDKSVIVIQYDKRSDR
jgi:hypothetical protein